MALPAFRSASAKASGTTGALAVNLPASMVAGDIVILCATTIAGGSITISTAGSITTWTEITSGGLDVASGEKLYVWWGRWTSGATGPSVTPGSDHCCAGTVAYSGCVPNGSPIGTSATSTEVTSDTSFSFATGISSGENDCLIICVASNGNDSNTATVGNMANTSLASLANRQDFCTTSGGGGGYSLQEGTKATAGTMGTFTSTYSASTPKSYIAFNLRPVVAVNLSAGVGGLTLTGVAPTVTATDNKNFAAGVGALTLSGLAPTVVATNNKNFSTDVGIITISGFAPSVNIGVNINAGVGALSINGFAPTVSITDNKNLTADVGGLTVSGFAPSVQLPININGSTGLLTVTGFEPTLNISDHKNFNADFGQLNISGFSPSVDISGGSVMIVSETGLLIINGFAPTIVGGNRQVIPIGSGIGGGGGSSPISDGSGSSTISRIRRYSKIENDI